MVTADLPLQTAEKNRALLKDENYEEKMRQEKSCYNEGYLKLEKHKRSSSNTIHH